jgi:DnaJ-class molecular chaperone
MTNLLKCESCNGHKNILALGNILKVCVTCNGLGFVEDKEKIICDDIHRVAKAVEEHEQIPP